ncbi:MAG TPA: hypothetical protein PLU99_15640 [Phycisphaerae bacterium]|jgi:hypothetical protein|nr:hypothetical protein [Phycisphaerae bacterium]
MDVVCWIMLASFVGIGHAIAGLLIMYGVRNSKLPDVDGDEHQDCKAHEEILIARLRKANEIISALRAEKDNLRGEMCRKNIEVLRETAPDASPASSGSKTAQSAARESWTEDGYTARP